MLTDTLSSALAIWQTMNRKVIIVTSEGDVIDAKGILTGGSGDGVGAGILKRNREIREFTAGAGKYANQALLYYGTKKMSLPKSSR